MNMKKLKLENSSYKILIADFKQWLDILGYAETTIYNLPTHLQEFMYYLEQQGIRDINHILPDTIKAYYKLLKERSNQKRYGGLSSSYLNKHQQALKKFREYLKQHGHSGIPLHLKQESNTKPDPKSILTTIEIKALFAACAYSHKSSRIRSRDKAILVLLYSCGLRRSEVTRLTCNDIQYEYKRIHISKAKNNKARLIPINSYNLQLLEDYHYQSRHQFYNSDKTDAFLVNSYGKGLGGQSLCNRLQSIAKAITDSSIIDKGITPHSLRHSIATHLLQNEVPLETIKSFLGHSSLESTQIYTHIVKTIDNELYRLPE